MIGSEDERVNQDVGTPREGPTPPVCDNCHHAYGEHTGRSYTQRGVIGPPDRFHWGGGCSNPGDGIHSCPCAEWMVLRHGRRQTQRTLDPASLRDKETAK